MVFLVVMYVCESWTVKKAEHQRTDAFELLEKTLESLLDCKEIQPVYPKGDQSWVFIGRTDVEAETSILWPPLWRTDSLEKKPWCCARLKVGGVGDNRGWDGWITSLTWLDVSLSKLQKLVMEREAWHAAVHGVAKSWTWLSDWTELNFSKTVSNS